MSTAPMSTSNNGTVTIDRGYFDTLLRRANFNGGTVKEAKTLGAASTILISVAEYKKLEQVSRKYENLQRNLILGGITTESIALLSQDGHTPPIYGRDKSKNQQLDTESTVRDDDATSVHDSDIGGGGVRLLSTTASSITNIDMLRRPGPARGEVRVAAPHTPVGHYYGRPGHFPESTMGSRDLSDALYGEELESNSVLSTFGMSRPQAGAASYLGQALPPRPMLERTCVRTIHLSNLPETVTHGDIEAAVCGGPLLDLYLRPQDRFAKVSFFSAADARKYMEHVRKNDLYIKNKRVDVRWSESSFTVATHIASQISKGATRNLLIRQCADKITEAMIRADLDHIHNIVVIKVSFSGGDCYISTNTVHNAMFAKTCMMSRLKYKGYKFEWYPDVCAKPIPTLPPPKKSSTVAVPLKKSQLKLATNRFQLLDMDAESSKSNDEEKENNTEDDFFDSQEGDRSTIGNTYEGGACF